MNSEVATVDPDASIAEIRDRLVINKQRVLPVVEDGKVIGLISRTVEDRVFVVGRSRLPEVDVAEILSELGGGGHSYAASAAIKDTPLTQVEEKLRQILQARVHPRRLAREIMSFPVKSVTPEVTLEDAEVILNRYNINALPVLVDAKLLGLISRQTVEKGIFHGLKGHQVLDYMNTEVATVDPEASIAEIRDRLVINKQRVLPVVEDGKVIGLISRTDLLHLLISEDDEAQWSQPLRTKNIVVPDAGAPAQGHPGNPGAGGPGGRGIKLQRLRGGRVRPGPVAQP